MDSKQSIKPAQKYRIMDVVEAAGIDISEWRRRGPASPKFCYDWGFSSDDRLRVLLCLWYDDCEVDGEGIYQHWNFREYAEEMKVRKGPKAARARKVDRLIQDAWRMNVPLRVAILDEKERKKALKKDGSASKPDFRVLDSEAWRIASYDERSGECTLRRGTSSEFAARVSENDSSSNAERKVESPPSSSVDVEGLGIRDNELADDLLAEAARSDVSSTTRKSLIEARVGQGRFRADLIKAWSGKCAITGCSVLAMLRASHVKPWRSCQDSERLHAANGLLLTANLDALFDAGLISFSDDGEMLISDELSGESVADLGLPRPLRNRLSGQQKGYMAFHRNERFSRRKIR